MNAGADDVLLRPPTPGVAIDDVEAAVREAASFSLAGPALADLVTPGGRATVVIELPSLPLPSAASDPRREAISATIDQLTELGMSDVTILVASGLQRRPSPQAIGLLVPPEFRRRFRGRVVVHDAESEALVPLGDRTLRVAPELVETDLVVTVTAAETVIHGGPAAFMRAAGASTIRSSSGPSLLESGSSLGWELGLSLERLLGARVPLYGISLVLNLPLVFGGYPYQGEILERLAGSKLRRLQSIVPPGVRARVIDRVPRELSAAAVFGGTPSVAHSEALLRGIELKGTRVQEPFDAIVIGTPATTAFFPRERPNPVAASYLGLGVALRMWRGAFPIREGGTAILLHDFQRHFPTPTQTPYRRLFADPRTARDPTALREAEAAALGDAAAITAYREGRALHPLEPFHAWAGCDPVLSRLGNVLVAGCRDAHAARQLGFVPAVSPGVALAMARSSGAKRIGFLMSPPYFPLVVGD